MSKKPVKDNHVFINSSGMKFSLIPISMLEVEAVEQNIKKIYQNRGEPIDPPTYEVEVAGGGKQTLPLTANNLEVENDVKESVRRKLDWATYQNALNRMTAEINNARTGMILEGIDVQEIKDDKWLARCKRLKIPLPEDQDELAEFYKKSQVIRTPEDILNVELAIIQLSSGRIIKPEEIATVTAKFRGIIYQELEGTGKVDNPEGGSGSPA